MNFENILIKDLNPCDASTVLVERSTWDSVAKEYRDATATYKPGKDPRVIISNELYNTTDDRFFKRPDVPTLGTEIQICDLVFEIVGFIYRAYYGRDERRIYDVVAEMKHGNGGGTQGIRPEEMT